ncbi:N-acetylglucosamine kinase [Hamadaea tsunoensis]|uniref:N-acetylglucosamine kinase n=1 Tax=Hamadaea tsunoensis TaxID=53368 RepID=UPI0004008C6F|nr:BadF/BadG/BcrA/BcrD ATPase family protein [Hamadaea tsunoensis]
MTDEARDLIVGVDAGGTSTRAVLVDSSGAVLRRGHAGPGNPVTDGAAAAAALQLAIRAALEGRSPDRVAAVALGVAGVTGVAAARAHYDRALAELGLTAPLLPFADAVTAFAAGTHAPRGAVLIAGTGAVAALVRDAAITRTADGHGWLLGDRGSGVWLGLEAVRRVVRHWPASAFADEVRRHAGASDVDGLVRWGNAARAGGLGALSPVVCSHAGDDPVAKSIVDDAARELVATLDDLGDPDGPIVLAGGLLTGGTPVQTAVAGLLTTRGATVAIAGDAAEAAARLARAAIP